MPLTKKETKFLIEASMKLKNAAEKKRVRGEDFSDEIVRIMTIQSRLMTDNMNPHDVNWFLDFFEEPALKHVGEKISMFSRLVGGTPFERFPSSGFTGGDVALSAAGIFSHLKTIQDTRQANWIKISEGLLMGLLLTDLTSTKGVDIKMPISSFIIELPRRCVYTYHRRTGKHEARYIIVTEAERPKVGRHLFIYLWSQPNEQSVDAFDDNVNYFPIDISDERESIQTFIDVYEELLKEDLERLRSEGVQKPDVRGEIFGEELFGADFRQKIIRIVINTILYLNSYNPTIQSANQAKIDAIKARWAHRKKFPLKAKKEIERLEEDPHYVIGTDIQISHADIEAIMEAQKKEKKKGRRTGTGHKLTRPSLTRGHWKMQAHGPEFSLRRLIWIKPYIRGKELGGDVVPHTYHVSNPSCPWYRDEYYDDDEFDGMY